MREILFRGKRIDYSEWLYGQLIIDNDKAHHIYVFKQDILGDVISGLRYVNEDTVGQYTGLTDKNGTKIFEGDILKDNGVYFTVFYADGGFAIESNPTYFGYGCQGGSNPRESLSDMQTGSYVESHCEVVGNIYDNENILK